MSEAEKCGFEKKNVQICKDKRIQDFYTGKDMVPKTMNLAKLPRDN